MGLVKWRLKDGGLPERLSVRLIPADDDYQPARPSCRDDRLYGPKAGFRRPSMEVPTNKQLIERIKSGEVRVGTIPCPPDRIPALGDTVRFREAVFDHFSVARLVPDGEAVSAVLTSVFDMGEPYFRFTLCTLQWDAKSPAERG